jgi:hypothetical protein
MKRLILTVALVVCSFGCIPPSTEKVKENLTYFKDERTGQCFAYISVYTGDSHMQVSVTYVPCTPEVEKVLDRNHR